MALKITIAGSYGKHLDRILVAREEFISLGAKVLRPPSNQKIVEGDITRMEGDPEEMFSIREAQFQAIYQSDLLYIVNPGGYVGAAATLDVGFAYALRIPVCSAEPVFEEAVALIVSQIGTPKDILEKEG